MESIGNRYRIVRPLGEGGMGVVYEGVDQATGRAVAIKQLRSIGLGDPILLERFRREAVATSQLRHPNIIEFLDFVPGEAPAIVLELLRGESLRQALSRQGALPLELTSRIVDGLLAALDAAHRLGIVHRDLKPANIFLVETPQGPMPKLLDFGIAKLLEQTGPALTRASHVIGSATYMAPEQIRGAGVDARSDLFAVGLCLYEMLTGKRPYEGTMHQVMLRIMQGEPVPAHPALTPVLLDLLRRATHGEMSARFSSALEMRRAFHDALHASSTMQRPLTGPHTASVWAASVPTPMPSFSAPQLVPLVVAPLPSSRGSMFLAGVATMGVLLLLGAGGLYAWWQLQAPPPAPLSPVAASAVTSAPTPAAVAPTVTATASASSTPTRPAASSNPTPRGGKSPADDGGVAPPPSKLTVNFIVSTMDERRLSRAALFAFLEPIKACFTEPNNRVGIELRFSSSGQVTETLSSSGSYDVPRTCIEPRLRALKGRTPAGYVPGSESFASVFIRS